MNWTKPKKEGISEYKWGYIQLVPEGNIVEVLELNRTSLNEFVSTLRSSELEYRYAAGKWTIKEILVHIIDTERIFAYRILCFLRGETSELPGYDQDRFAANSFANARSIESILNEYDTVRRATRSLLLSINETCLDNKGVANGTFSSVRELVYMVTGHEIHHLNVIKDRYLNARTMP